MSLEQLPSEILSEIFGYLTYRDGYLYESRGYSSLCALARTCRRFSDIATTIFYTHLTLDVNWVDTQDHIRTCSLNRCSDANPSLVNRIDSAEIDWDYVDLESCNKLVSHLAKSTTLTKLTCILHRARWEALPALYDYASGSFPCLRHLTVELIEFNNYWDYLPVEQLEKLCQLPALESLTIRVPTGEPKTDVRPKMILTNLTHLDFDYRPVSFEALKSILPRAPNLEYLHLSLPGYGQEFERKMSDDMAIPGYELTGVLHSAHYGTLLAPVAGSLKELALDGDNVLFTQHDGTTIDLSQFVNLYHLEVTASVLFGPHDTAACCPWPRDVRKALPPHLEALHLTFDGDQGMFWSVEQMRKHQSSQTFDELWALRLENHHVDWLVELLHRNSVKKYPLKTVTISEQPVIDRNQSWKVVIWYGTDYLQTVAGEAEVDVSIRLLVPRDFESPEVEVWEESPAFGRTGTYPPSA